MPEVETITWRELTGNKYTKGLEPAMVSEAGYVRQRKIRKIGDVMPTLFNVVYDREYLTGSIGNYLCKTLYVLGKEEVLKLVSEAWDDMYPKSSK